MGIKPPKQCTKCKLTLPREAFRTRAYDTRYVYSLCRKCENIKNKEYYKALREEVLKHYGNACQCCGETTPQFLALDHIFGGGLKEQREKGLGSKYYLWVRRVWPSYLRVLCHNCNVGRQLNGGVCPHKGDI